VQLRRDFPGPIEQIIYAHWGEFTKREDAFQMCHVPCYLMRIGFPDINWEFPQIFWLRNQSEWHNNQTVCFDSLLVPANTHQHFTSPVALDLHRSQALKMCDIPERPVGDHPKTVFIYLFI
jgi:hypothetical protein